MIGSFSIQKHFGSILNILIAVIMLLSFLPVSSRNLAHAESDATQGADQSGITENLTDTYQQITGNDAQAETKKQVSSQKYYLVSPDRANEIRLPDSSATIIIPEGAVSNTVAIDTTTFATEESTGKQILNLFEFHAWEIDTEKLDRYLDEIADRITIDTDNTTSEEEQTTDNTTGSTDDSDADFPETTDNTTPTVPDITDNTTNDIPDLTDNTAPEIPAVTDNTTSDLPDTTDNTTGDPPDSIDDTPPETPEISDNTTGDTPEPTEEITPDIPAESDNTTPDLPSITDDTTTDDPATTDNSTPTLPDTGDDATAETPETTDNTTPALPDTSDNTTPDLPEQTDNTTSEIPETTDTITPELPDDTDNTTTNLPDETANVTSDDPSLSDNTTVDSPDISENVTLNRVDLMRMVSQEQITDMIDTSREVSVFNRELTLSIAHSDGELQGLDKDSLRLYCLNEKTRTWELVESSRFDAETGILTAAISHFSLYGDQANPYEVGPGRVMAAQVGLQSGSAMYSYPFELPPGPGGFTPSLELSYNSGSVNEMKDKQDVGSWVGTGWSLNLGRISQVLGTNSFSLELNGVSYSLVTVDYVHYTTNPDEYLSITRSGNTWTVLDKNGTTYRFGGTADSQQYVDGSTYYRWDLSLIRDTNNNTATISYVQDVKTNWIRSAYPEYLEYGNVEVHFISNYDENDVTDGYLRYDNPKTYLTNNAPKIMENKHLDVIEVKVNESLIRKYEFDYTTTNRVLSNDYSPAVYYAGSHTLTSVTQVGNDGTSSLPVLSFSYDSKSIYRYSTSDATYSGNPGNPASLSWDFLKAIDSGYDGLIGFSYTQIPDTSEQNVWTREVISSKSIDADTSDNGSITTVTFYPDTDPESNTVDGIAYPVDDCSTWAEIRSAPGTYSDDSAPISYFAAVAAGSYYDTFCYLFRSLFLFDTSSIPDDATILNATFSVYGIDKRNDYTAANPAINIYSSSPVSNTSIVPGDYNTLGSTPFSDDSISYANYNTSGYNDFSLNENGIAGIDKEGITKFGIREANHDVANVAPSPYYNGYILFTGYFSEQGEGYKPKLEISYSNDFSVNTTVMTYDYSDDPEYSGTGWDQQYRGFSEVTETDADGNYTVHSYYTTGDEETDKLTGKEYKTEWFNDSAEKLKETQYDWSVDTVSGILPVTPSYLGVFCSESPFSYDSVFAKDGGDKYIAHNYDYAGLTQTGRAKFYQSTGTITVNLGASTVTGVFFKDTSHIYVSNAYYEPAGTSANGRINVYEYTGGTPVQQLGFSSLTANDVHVTSNGNVYIARGERYQGSSTYGRVESYTSGGTMISTYGYSYSSEAFGVYVDGSGNVYIARGEYYQNGSDYSSGRVEVYASNGNYIRTIGAQGGYIATDVYIGDDGYVYITYAYISNGTTSTSRVDVYTTAGTFVRTVCTVANSGAFGIHVDSDGFAYIANGTLYQGTSTGGSVTVYQVFQPVEFDTIHLDQVDDITCGSSGNKTSRIRYEYDDYGNVITEYLDGDTSTNADDKTVWRTYCPNTTDNILNKVARERVYATAMATDSGGANLRAETLYYYDGNNASVSTPPTIGNLTRVESKKDSSNSVSSYFTYDGYGNVLTETDANGNTANYTYDASHTYFASVSRLLVGAETYAYTWNWSEYSESGVMKVVATDINGQTTTTYYDEFNRIERVIRPGDSFADPSVSYLYTDWGTIGSQNIETRTKTGPGEYIWQKDFFDGLGRVVQTHSEGESGHTIVAGTTVYDSRGMVERSYVSQDVASELTVYQAPGANWRYSSYDYDALGRTETVYNADNTTVGYDYSEAWYEEVTNTLGFVTGYTYDAFGQLIEVAENVTPAGSYAVTAYEYDTLGNLLEVEDDDGNTSNMTYDWLSRKTGMTDPDMGTWSYGYDGNGNLTTQTDARGKTITFVYDGLNRLTNKNYSGANMTNVSYTYDSTSGGNYGKGQRTGMTDAIGTVSYTYDTHGRLVSEDKYINAVHYITGYTYDSADRVETITYPTGETVTQTYSDRGLPYSVSGSAAGNLVTSILYNGLGSVTEINFSNGLKTTYGYYGTGGAYDTTGGYYGRLWEITTEPQGGGTALMDVRHAWDAGGNLATRQDVLTSETETFGYDALDRLVSVGGAYSASYEYDEIGNLVRRNGVSYSYDTTQPHAVDAVGGMSYIYDSNGNMTTRDGQTIEWDAENRPEKITENSTVIATYVYDGDGNRIMKTEGGETVLYINSYYEENLTTGNITTSYYIGGRLIAQREGDELRFMHQDHLSGTSLTTSANGSSLGSVKYYPYGGTRSGDVPTDIQFTGQRLDGTGLYYYGARYYDPVTGRFISADTIIPNPADPQCFNRYSYCLNNPLKYNDPSGHFVEPENEILADAWKLFADICPDIATVLEDSTKIFHIDFAESSNPNEAAVSGPPKNSYNKVVININDNMDQDNIAELVGLIAHEAVHCLAAEIRGDWQEPTLFEEAIAYKVQHWIGRLLNYYDYDITWSTASNRAYDLAANVQRQINLVGTGGLSNPEVLIRVLGDVYPDNVPYTTPRKNQGMYDFESELYSSTNMYMMPYVNPWVAMAWYSYAQSY